VQCNPARSFLIELLTIIGWGWAWYPELCRPRSMLFFRSRTLITLSEVWIILDILCKANPIIVLLFILSIIVSISLVGNNTKRALPLWIIQKKNPTELNHFPHICNFTQNSAGIPRPLSKDLFLQENSAGTCKYTELSIAELLYW
jgi:hypothetical protein